MALTTTITPTVQTQLQFSAQVWNDSDTIARAAYAGGYYEYLCDKLFSSANVTYLPKFFWFKTSAGVQISSVTVSSSTNAFTIDAVDAPYAITNTAWEAMSDVDAMALSLSGAASWAAYQAGLQGGSYTQFTVYNSAVTNGGLALLNVGGYTKNTTGTFGSDIASYGAQKRLFGDTSLVDISTTLAFNVNLNVNTAIYAAHPAASIYLYETQLLCVCGPTGSEWLISQIYRGQPSTC